MIAIFVRCPLGGLLLGSPGRLFVLGQVHFLRQVFENVSHLLGTQLTPILRPIDVFGNAYNDRMMSYQTLSTQPRAFLAMTGLTTTEFRDLLPAFETAY